jgi:hypothetical protein
MGIVLSALFHHLPAGHHVVDGRFSVLFAIFLSLAFILLRPFAVLLDETFAGEFFRASILFEKTARAQQFAICHVRFLSC